LESLARLGAALLLFVVVAAAAQLRKIDIGISTLACSGPTVFGFFSSTFFLLSC
jgi:hypothetical protein